MPRLPSVEDCLIRHIFLPKMFKHGLVHQRVFKDDDRDGLSMTSTGSEILGLDDLDTYLVKKSEGLGFLLGAAIFSTMSVESLDWFRWEPDPIEGPYGTLHVLGPKPEVLLDVERRKLLAKAADDSGWSRDRMEQIGSESLA